MSATERCVGCGAAVPGVEGPTHRYLESAPGCWAAFGEVLAREFGDPAHFEVHSLTVDTYAVQHPGRPSPQTIGSAAVHLISLHELLVEDVGLARASFVRRAAKGELEADYVWLEPPADMGPLTVLDVVAAADAAEHAERVWSWARSVWNAWGPHHGKVSEWAAALRAREYGTAET